MQIPITLPQASHSILLTGLLFSAGLWSASAYASGFQVTENRAAGIGTSHSDNAAANDPSTLASNPAGLTRLAGMQATLTGVGVYGKFKFHDTGSTTITGGKASGSDGGNPGGFTPIAANFVSYQINDRLYSGFGIYAPYGLPTKYSDDWVGRYHAVKTDLKTINLNPSLAFKVNERLSIGAGAIAQYATATFSNRIGLGTDPSAPVSSTLPCNTGMEAICTIADGLLGSVGAAVPSEDGKVKVKVDSWGFGYNLGAMLNLSPDARLGVSYRSHVKQTMKGDVHITYPTLALDTSRTAHTELDLPEVASISYYQNVTPKLSLMADVSWTRWSRFNEVRLKFDDQNLSDIVVPQNWHNTTRVAVGSEYRLGDKQTLRAGAAIDPSPVTDENRTPRIPDADRVWVSFGYGYALSKQSVVDLGYAHLFVKDSNISDNRSATTGGTLNGRYTNGSADIVGVTLRHKF
jgi:long-chain fatty acid transport protein